MQEIILNLALKSSTGKFGLVRQIPYYTDGKKLFLCKASIDFLHGGYCSDSVTLRISKKRDLFNRIYIHPYENCCIIQRDVGEYLDAEKSFNLVRGQAVFIITNHVKSVAIIDNVRPCK